MWPKSSFHFSVGYGVPGVSMYFYDRIFARMSEAADSWLLLNMRSPTVALESEQSNMPLLTHAFWHGRLLSLTLPCLPSLTSPLRFYSLRPIPPPPSRWKIWIPSSTKQTRPSFPLTSVELLKVSSKIDNYVFYQPCQCCGVLTSEGFAPDPPQPLHAVSFSTSDLPGQGLSVAARPGVGDTAKKRRPFWI
jgi:hypothetical protein